MIYVGKSRYLPRCRLSEGQLTIVMDWPRGGVRRSLTVVTMTGLLQLNSAAYFDAEVVGATEKCQALEGRRRGSGPGCELSSSNKAHSILRTDFSIYNATFIPLSRDLI